MYEEVIDVFISQINSRKNDLSNAGTRPLVSQIIEKAQNIKGFIVGSNQDSAGLIVIAIPCSEELLSFYFKGWKVEDFERLAIELENLKT